MAKNINTLRDLTDRLKNRAQGLDDLVGRLQDNAPVDAVVVVKTLTATTEYISHLVAIIMSELPPYGSGHSCREFFAVNEPIPEITESRTLTITDDLRTEAEATGAATCPRCQHYNAMMESRLGYDKMASLWKCRDCGYEVIESEKDFERWAMAKQQAREAAEPVSSRTKRYPTRTNADGQVETLSLDGDSSRWINAKAYQQSLNEWPTPVAKFIGSDGEPTLTNITTAEPERCGCEIVGCGTLQFPLVIQYCEAHAKTEVA